MNQGEVLMSGTPGEVRRPLNPIGSMYAHGEEWTARSPSGDRLGRGEHVRVVGQDGLTLLVERSGSIFGRITPAAGVSESGSVAARGAVGSDERPILPEPGDQQEVFSP